MSNRTRISYSDGIWLNPPNKVEQLEDSLLVTTKEASDFWQETYYGFYRDSGHALLINFPIDSAIEVSFINDFTSLYDQAGIFIRIDEKNWIKAGIELSDGLSQLGAVVTNIFSDWSLSPVSDWNGREVTIRASRNGDAVISRAKVENEPWRTFRLAHLDRNAEAKAGLFCCSPSRSDLVVKFTGLYTDNADINLH